MLSGYRFFWVFCNLTSHVLGTGDRTLLNELKIAPLPNEVCRLSWGATRILDTNICIGDGTAGSCQVCRLLSLSLYLSIFIYI